MVVPLLKIPDSVAGHNWPALCDAYEMALQKFAPRLKYTEENSRSFLWFAFKGQKNCYTYSSASDVVVVIHNGLSFANTFMFLCPFQM